MLYSQGIMCQMYRELLFLIPSLVVAFKLHKYLAFTYKATLILIRSKIFSQSGIAASKIKACISVVPDGPYDC